MMMSLLDHAVRWNQFALLQPTRDGHLTTWVAVSLRTQDDATVMRAVTSPRRPLATSLLTKRGPGQPSLVHIEPGGAVFIAASGPTLADVFEAVSSADRPVLRRTLADEILQRLAATEDNQVPSLFPRSIRVGWDGTVAFDGAIPVGNLGEVFAYISREQVRGVLRGPRSTVFSAGALLLWMYAGRAPFSGSSEFEVLEAVRAGSPSTEDLPPGVRALVAACLAHAEGDRPPHVDWVRERLLRRCDPGRCLTTGELCSLVQEHFGPLRAEEQALAREVAALDPAQLRTLPVLVSRPPPFDGTIKPGVRSPNDSPPPSTRPSTTSIAGSARSGCSTNKPSGRCGGNLPFGRSTPKKPTPPRAARRHRTSRPQKTR